MIQRIQSVYLGIGSLLLASNFLLDQLWTGPAAESSDWFTPVTLGLYSLAIAGALFSIVLFNNRHRQMQVILAVMLTTLIGLIVLCSCLYAGGILPGAASVEAASSHPVIGLMTPVAALLLFALARRGVRRDIKLLKSVDRLR